MARPVISPPGLVDAPGLAFPGANLPEVPEASPPMDPFNRVDPASLINLVPDGVAQSFMDAGRRRPDLFGLDEHTLWKKLRESECSPSPTANRLRLQFWAEYDRVSIEGGKMVMARVYGRICHQYQFHSWVQRPEIAAWLCTMPVGYKVKMEEALEFGIEQLRDILDMPHDGNQKLMELKAKIVALLDQRVKGGVVQKIEQRNMNLSVTATEKDVQKMLENKGSVDIDARIAELERRDRHRPHGRPAVPEVLDAE